MEALEKMGKIQETLDRMWKSMEEDRKERKEMREEWDKKWKEMEEKVEQEREEVRKELAEKVKEIEEKVKVGAARESEGGSSQDGEGKDKGPKQKQLEDLEWRLEEVERERKRNNIVIAGLKGEGMDRAGLERWIEEQLGVKAEVRKTWIIRGRIGNRMGAELKDRDEKEKIMAIKNQLKGKDIDHDMTWRERRTREKLNGWAREMRKEGKMVKVGRNRMKVGEKEWVYSEREEKLSFRSKPGKGT